MADEGDPETTETPRGESEDEVVQQDTDQGDLEIVGEPTEDDQKMGGGEQKVNGKETEKAEEAQETDRGNSDDENTKMPDREPSRVCTQEELEGDTPLMEKTEEDYPTHDVEMEINSTNNEEVVGETEERLSEHNTAQESGEEIIITEDLDQEPHQPPATNEETRNETIEVLSREKSQIWEILLSSLIGSTTWTPSQVTSLWEE